jgi:hypothetical protein
MTPYIGCMVRKNGALGLVLDMSPGLTLRDCRKI